MSNKTIPDTYKYLDWKDFENCCYCLNQKFVLNHYTPEIIIGLSRGGVIPSRILSDILNNLDLYFIDVKLYDGTNKRDSAVIRNDFDLFSIKDKRIVVVDDIYDSGTTIKAVVNHLKSKGIKNVSSATLYAREGLNEYPTYYAKIVKRKDWIVFPWEKNEFKKEKL